MAFTTYSEAYTSWLAQLPTVKSNWDDLDDVIPLVKASASIFALANRTGQALEYVRDMFESHIGSGFSVLAASSIPHYAMHSYIATLFNGGDVTMEAMLEAMWDSDKLRNFHFINYIDAMRASIWNTEVYETHLAEWYEHFQSQ